MKLPDYSPPNAQKAHVAVALAPLFVLLSFTLMVNQIMEPDTGFAVFLACTIWVVWEMHDYQRTVDAYNAEYVSLHLAWRTSDSLHRLVVDDRVHEPTREFVRRFLAAGRKLLRDGPSV